MKRQHILGGLSLSLAVILSLSALMVAATGDTRVADAAMQGNKTAVLSLVKQGADVNAAQGDGMTALHWAAVNGDAELAQTLLYAGANLKATTRLGGFSPLYLAAKTGNEGVIDTLLKSGADVKATAIDGQTPLMMAAASGNAAAIKLLIDKGADVNAKETEHGQTPLIFASAYGRIDAIKVLLQNGAKANIATKIEQPPAAQRGFGGAPGPLPPGIPGAPVAPGAAAPAGAAAAGGGRGGRGGPQPAGAAAATPAAPPAAPAPATTANTPPPAGAGRRGGAAPPDPQAAAAANNGNGDDQPIRGAADPEGGMTPLMYAARQGNIDALKVLLDGGADINTKSGDNSTAILIAAINAKFDTVMFLLDRGANPNLASMAGATPVYGILNVQWAMHSLYPQPSTKYEKAGYLEVLKALLDRGANPNAKINKPLWYTAYNFGLDSSNPSGATPFWRASQAGDIDAMRLLVSRGADASIATTEGVTPLLIASGFGFHGNDETTVPGGPLPAVKYLVDELHLDVNAADTRSGFTALHNAAGRGDNDMILFLVARGAKVDILGKKGETVADRANGPRERVQPYYETVALLELLGSKNSHKCVSC